MSGRCSAIKTGILFDLDGTLIQSEEGFTASLRYALETLGVPVGNPAVLRNFIGPPMAESLRKYYQLNEAQIEQAIGLYATFYGQDGIYRCKLYHGVPEMLQALHSAGHLLAIATSKPEPFAKAIVHRLGMAPYFAAIVGPANEGGTCDKSPLLCRAIEKAGLGKSPCVMVGDRCHDMEAAATLGLGSVGVLYGYGSRGELEDAGATHIVADIPALQSLLLTL